MIGMPTDDGGLTDEVQVTLVRVGASLRRPAKSAHRAAWVDYLVALGADRGALEGDTRHWDDAAGAYVKAKKLTRRELMDLAARLSGSS